MTLQMIIALGILIFMIVLIMADVLPFGAPPILASLLLVVFSSIFGADWETQWDVAYAFSGFTNSTVWMVAFFMVVIAAAQKTSFMGKIQQAMVKFSQRGGFTGYILLLLVVMLGASVLSGTGYYMLVLSLVVSLPYTEALAPTKILMPLGFATGNALIPVNVAFYVSLTAAILSSVSYTGEVATTGFILMSFIVSIGCLVWSIIAYRFLPSRTLSENATEMVSTSDATGQGLPMWQEVLTAVMLVVSVLGMVFSSSLGEISYVIPGICAFVLLFAKVITFKEMRDCIFSPLILMMSGVIPVANALADSGFTALIGEAVAGMAGNGMPGFVLVLIFAALTSICATLTGASIGSAYVFAPIGAATCVALGYSPVAVVAACVLNAWNNCWMPIDGLPALIYGIGGYSMKEFWEFTIPRYLITLLLSCVGAVIAFPL